MQVSSAERWRAHEGARVCVGVGGAVCGVAARSGAACGVRRAMHDAWRRWRDGARVRADALQLCARSAALAMSGFGDERPWASR
eukprot:4850352-Prymnesium_polylepis.1